MLNRMHCMNRLYQQVTDSTSDVDRKHDPGLETDHNITLEPKEDKSSLFINDYPPVNLSLFPYLHNLGSGQDFVYGP